MTFTQMASQMMARDEDLGSITVFALCLAHHAVVTKDPDQQPEMAMLRAEKHAKVLVEKISDILNGAIEIKASAQQVLDTLKAAENEKKEEVKVQQPNPW